MEKINDWYVHSEDDPCVEIIRNEGIPDLHHLESALEHVTDFSLAIDGGAHYGTWSLALAAQFDSVESFEPIPMISNAGMLNMFHRDLTRDKVRWWPIALGPELGTCDLMFAPNASMSSYVRMWKKGITPVVPLDLFGWSPGFVKLDLEGSEVVALRGARETLKRSKPVVLIEWKPHKAGNNGGTLEEAHEIHTGS